MERKKNNETRVYTKLKMPKFAILFAFPADARAYLYFQMKSNKQNKQKKPKKNHKKRNSLKQTHYLTFNGNGHLISANLIA